MIHKFSIKRLLIISFTITCSLIMINNFFVINKIKEYQRIEYKRDKLHNLEKQLIRLEHEVLIWKFNLGKYIYNELREESIMVNSEEGFFNMVFEEDFINSDLTSEDPIIDNIQQLIILSKDLNKEKNVIVELKDKDIQKARYKYGEVMLPKVEKFEKKLTYVINKINNINREGREYEKNVIQSLKKIQWSMLTFAGVIGLALIYLVLSVIIGRVNTIKEVIFKTTLKDLKVRFPFEKIKKPEGLYFINESHMDFSKPEEICFFNIGSYSNYFGKEAVCPFLNDGSISCCDYCKIYKRATRDEIATIGIWFNMFAGNLNKIFHDFLSATTKVDLTADELRMTMDNIITGDQSKYIGVLNNKIDSGMDQLREHINNVIAESKREILEVQQSIDRLNEIAKMSKENYSELNSNYSRIDEENFDYYFVHEKFFSPGNMKEIKDLSTMIGNSSITIESLGMDTTRITEEISQLLEEKLDLVVSLSEMTIKLKNEIKSFNL